jgi:hypothetical protein
MRIKDILEAFDFKKKDKGQVPFKTSTLNDPHIQAIIAEESRETGVPVADIMDELSKSPSTAMLAELKKYSPLLYDTLAQNAVESAVFKRIEDSVKLKKMSFDKVKFDFKVFLKLCELIRLDHTPGPDSPAEAKGLFPLKAPGEALRINSIRPILVPTNNPDLQAFNQVTTAAATANGDFIFNKEFMQNMLNYGAAIGVKPKGAKYESNGGVIPDAYCYIEFLILHEVFHYIFGDFSMGSRFKQYSHAAHNWASDFRSNYFLVKNGYEQLPIGLYSDDLNFDRETTSSYQKLIKVVHDEMMKLPPHLRQWAENEFESDVHQDDPYTPQVGDIVQNHDTGEIGKVTKVNKDGSIEVDPVDNAKDDIKSKGVNNG